MEQTKTRNNNDAADKPENILTTPTEGRSNNNICKTGMGIVSHGQLYIPLNSIQSRRETAASSHEEL